MKRIIIYGIIIFIFSIGIGFYYGSLWKMNHVSITADDKSKNENLIPTVATEEKIAYNASFALKKYFKECGHFKFNYSELPKELINLSKEELGKLYPDWNIEKFSSEEVVLSKDIEEMCDEHFILKLDKNTVEIYKDLNNGNTKLYKTTNISKDYLTDMDIEKLKKGIYIYGIGNLNSAIEDFE